MSSDDLRKVRFRDLLIEPVRNGIYKEKEFHGRGCKIVNMGELFSYPRIFDVPMKRVELTDKERHKSLLRAGDLLFARRSLVASGAGRCAVVKAVFESTTFESSIIRARPDPQLASSDYLFYFFSSPVGRETMGQILRQVAVAGITGSDLMELMIVCPSVGDQVRISETLAALDDRIALLRETNTTLEAIAQALFKSWFVDFDPVRAKQQGLAPAGMDEATAALFPDSFEEAALGSVPKSWRVGTLSELADLNARTWSGRSHPERVGYLDLANVKDNEVATVAEFAFAEAPSRARRALRNGDTIVGTVRPGNRSFAFIHEPEPHLTASTGFAVLSPKAVDSTAFVYLAATQDASIEHLAHVADGGAYPAVRPDAVSGLVCVVPSTAILRAFNTVACPLLEKVSANQRQTQTLATLRDTLLPRLISGQLRLPESQPKMESKP